jgi:hypothetical protein
VLLPFARISSEGKMDYDEKKEPELDVGGVEMESASSEEQEKYGTANDKTDMHRLGKLQQLRVRVGEDH